MGKPGFKSLVRHGHGLCGRYLLLLVTVGTCLSDIKASSLRLKRQVSNSLPSQPSGPKAYQPPISIGAPSMPVASSAAQQNAYQPPISLLRSNEYQSPLNAPRTYQSQPVPGHSSQTYMLSNQPQTQPRSVQYIPPAMPSGSVQQSFSVQQQPAPNAVPQPATSFSVQQQPPHFAILSDSSGLPHSTAERTYSTHSKVVESHVPAQAIHKAPASEIQSEKGPAAKEKDNAKDEYVVYYYYYYDNDTAPNNLSLNFDDIPSLEAYDNDKHVKDAEKSASARTLATNVNSLTPVVTKPEKDAAGQSESFSSQPRSVGDAYSRSNSNAQDDSLVQPLKPVSNVFRYGSNEVPRFPVLPNFIVTESPTTVKSEIAPPDSLTTVPTVTQPALVHAQPDLKTGDEADDDLNNVLDHASDNKAIDDKVVEEEPTTTTTTTTTEPPTTTEEPTTTTEKPRRSRPSFGGGSRRRFNANPTSASSPSFNSNRSRQSQSRSSTSSTTSTTTTSSPTRRGFQGGSRIRPRPAIGSNRPRPSSRASETTSEDKPESRAAESTTASTTTSRSRFTSASPRRFQSSRSRSQTTSSSSSTSTTTRAPSRPNSSSGSRPAIRPRPNPISRNRRPGFPRPRPGSETEETETTTTPVPPTEEDISPETANDELPSTNDESNETEEDNETSVEETEEPTTTEGNRFSALFRPRNRNALGNRPRPVIGNRPPRS